MKQPRFLGMMLLTAVFALARTAASSAGVAEVGVALGTPSAQPLPGGTFSTDLTLSSANCVPGAIELNIRYDAQVLSLMNIAVRDSCSFWENTFVDSLPGTAGTRRLAGFQVRDTTPYEPPYVLAALTWRVAEDANRNTDIGIEVLRLIEQRWNPVHVVTSGQRIVLTPGSDTPGDVLARQFRLGNNYPNPFNPLTRIPYALPVETPVHVTIFNVAGQLVATLVDRVQPAGFYTVEWDGRNSTGQELGTGIYLYRLETPAFGETRKMLLVK